MNLKKIFGKNLRYYRHQKGYTQEELAELTDLYPSYMSDIENGRYGPSFENIELIAKILEIKPEQLFTDSDITHTKLPRRVDKK